MKYLGIILIAILACNTSNSQDRTYQKCEIRAFTSPFTKDALSIYNEIDEQVIISFYVDSLELTGHIVSVIASKDGWLQISTDGFSEGLFAWVKGGKLGVATRNYNGETIFLYKEPTKEAKALGYITEQQIVAIYAGNKQWALVKAKNKNGEWIEGWLESEMQCGNPYTICP
jgi:hypothetical protein